jgi:hypothetical protein
MQWRVLYGILAVFGALCVTAQQRPIFDVDDFVDPGLHNGPLFISRLVVGATRNSIDDYRPLRDDVGFIHIANSFYWSHFQLDYKRSEVRAKNGPIDVQTCGCLPPIYFPTPPPADATPLPPHPGSKDTVQFGWYRSPTLRYQLSWSRQALHSDLTSFATGKKLDRLSGDEQSFVLDADTHFRIRGHDLWGSLIFARTVRSGIIDDRRQNDFLYLVRFPGRLLGAVVLHPTLTVGGVTGRGASGLNVVNPAFEAFWHEPRTRANLHVIWSPQSMRSGADGWETHHQIAVFIDRALYVKLFSKR